MQPPRQLLLNADIRQLWSASRAGSHTAGEPDPGLLPAASAPLLITVAAYLLILFAILRTFAFNPTGLIRIMDHYHAPRFWTESDIIQTGTGYDGQFFYYLAHDPLLRDDDPEAFLDYPAYRYGRILYPTLAWMAALGRPERLPWTLIGVNLLAVLVGTAAAVDIASSLGVSRWLALGFAFSPAVLIGMIADLAEPTAYALVIVGVALHLRNRHGGAGLVLALGTLARESSLLVPLGFALHAAARRAWGRAVAYALPLAIPLAWHLWVWARLGALPTVQAPTNFGLPLSGALYRAGLLLGLQPPLLGETLPDGTATELFVLAATVAVMLLGLVKIFRRREVFVVLLWLQSVAALCTGPLVWNGVASYSRVAGLLYLFYGLVLLTGPRHRARGAVGTPGDG